MTQGASFVRSTKAKNSTVQKTLFCLNGATNGKDAFSDPAFAVNKSAPVHRWVPWIAGFSNDFVRDVLSRYLPRKGTVLDPFSGVGTTLVEAVLQRHNAIGFEINPYAALASRVKSNAHSVPLDFFQNELRRFQRFFAKKIASEYQPRSVPPPGFRSRAPFFSPKVERKALIFFDFLETIENSRVKDLFRLAFGSTMVQYSNYSYEPSLSRRVSAGKAEIIDYPVEEAILLKLHAMREDIQVLAASVGKSRIHSRVIEDSFFQVRNRLKPKSVDIVITSPPYLNNYHYNRNTRPHLYWLGFAQSPKDLEPIEQTNFGKFWQTVRQDECLDLDFDLPGSDIQERLNSLRKLKPEKGVYGGNGWANYAAAYFNDCRKFAEGLNYALKPGGRAFVVIGNSILQGVVIPTDRYFGQVAESIGLELVRIDIPRATRVGNSIIQSDVRVAKAKKSDQLYEAIIELKKR
jgi:DNA modification methylase